MKKIMFCIVMAIMIPALVYAGPVLQEGVLGLGGGVSKFPTVSADAAYAIISAYGGDARYSFKNTPDKYTGHVLYNGDTFLLLNIQETQSIRFIPDVGSSAVTVEYTIFAK